MASDRARVVIVGAGRTGLSIGRQLRDDGRYLPVFVEPVEDASRQCLSAGFDILEGSGTDKAFMERALAGATAVVVAAPEFVAVPVAETARQAQCHYVDVVESPSVNAQIESVAESAASSFVPGCGLAPGYVAAMADEAIREAGHRGAVKVYVGVLPVHRTNRLGYGNIWSIDGLVTEYTSPCQAIVGGSQATLPPLSEYESLTIGGTSMEAFTTAGSLDRLMERLEGAVGSLVFKTLRFPGHLDYMKFLIDDLGFGERVNSLKNLLRNGLPTVEDDIIVLGVIWKSGQGDAGGGRRRERSHFQFIRSARRGDGSVESAVSLATAAHTCSVVDFLCGGVARPAGLLHPDTIGLEALAESPFFRVLETSWTPMTQQETFQDQ